MCHQLHSHRGDNLQQPMDSESVNEQNFLSTTDRQSQRFEIKKELKINVNVYFEYMIVYVYKYNCGAL